MTCIAIFSNYVPKSFLYTQNVLTFSSEIYEDQPTDCFETALKVVLIAGAFFSVIPALVVDLVRAGLNACGFDKVANLCLIDDLSPRPRRTAATTEEVRSSQISSRPTEAESERIAEFPSLEEGAGLQTWDKLLNNLDWMENFSPAQTDGFIFHSIKTLKILYPKANWADFIQSLKSDEVVYKHSFANILLVFFLIYSTTQRETLVISKLPVYLEGQQTLINSYRDLTTQQKVELFSRIIPQYPMMLDEKTGQLWNTIEEESKKIEVHPDFSAALDSMAPALDLLKSNSR